MAGMLTPIPHTPLAERLRAEGRLHEAEFSGNNTDDEVQFQPLRMSIPEMQRGYYEMLNMLFSPGAMFRRSRTLLQRLEPHIFHGASVRPSDLRAALRSVWKQGIMRPPRRAYLHLLWTGWVQDYRRAREARRAAARMRAHRRHLSRLNAQASRPETQAFLLGLIGPAHDAMLRSQPDRSRDDIAQWAAGIRDRIIAGSSSVDDLDTLYSASGSFFVKQQRLHRFPGAYLVKAFNLAIKGLHYEIVMEGIGVGKR
jgi:hypothetical protein